MYKPQQAKMVRIWIALRHHEKSTLRGAFCARSVPRGTRSDASRREAASLGEAKLHEILYIRTICETIRSTNPNLPNRADTLLLLILTPVLPDTKLGFLDSLGYLSDQTST